MPGNGFKQIVASHLNNLGLVRPSVDSLVESPELVAVQLIPAVVQPILDYEISIDRVTSVKSGHKIKTRL